MHLEGFYDVLYIITYSLAILILSCIADGKNRNPLGWGLIGGLFFPTSLICLALEPKLCPKCKEPLTKDERRLRSCPTCGTLVKRVKHGRSLIPTHEGTV